MKELLTAVALNSFGAEGVVFENHKCLYVARRLTVGTIFRMWRSPGVRLLGRALPLSRPRHIHIGRGALL